MKLSPKHFDGKRFYNPDAPQVRGFSDLLRWKTTSRPETSPRFIDDVIPSVPARRIESSELRVTLVNHSTVLLQQQNLNILTDPIWSERASRSVRAAGESPEFAKKIYRPSTSCC